MKKILKNKFMFILAFIFAFSTILFACNAINLSGGPNTTETVYGNGGSAVVKGDYLYFANAYVDYTNLTSVNDNKYDSGSEFTIYGIYRTKLGTDGKVVLDDDGIPQNVEILSYNIGGYSYSGLYICGDYLYYSTPYTASTSGSDSEIKTGLVRFDRIKLDGTGHQEIYKTVSYSSDCDYNIVYVNGTTYIAVLDGDKNLVVVNCTNTNVENSTFATNVSSFAVFEQTNIKYGETIATANTYAYYVVQDDNENYLMFRKPLAGGDAQTMISSSSEISIKTIKNGRVYYTLNNKLYSTVNGESEVKLYSQLTINSETSDTAGTIVDYIVLDDSIGVNLDRGVLGIYYDGTNYSFRIYNGYDNGTTSTLLNVSVKNTTVRPTLVATQDSEFYFQMTDSDTENESLYMVEFELTYSSNKFNLTNLADPKIIATNFSGEVNSTTLIDFDKERFFVYESEDESNISYLKMYMINEPSYTDDDENLVGQYIGILD
ncbi:MAG: hypothetical protein EOM55_00395 [Clostridia bacterium]|nr:hypothetical protein [Clostridia bacterium]